MNSAMAEGMVQDRVFLALLFIVGGSSLIWGLYLLFYVAPNSASGIFNTVLGLLVLIFTWAFLVPYVIPARTRSQMRPTVTAVPPARPAPARSFASGTVRPVSVPSVGPAPEASAPLAVRPTLVAAARSAPRSAAPLGVEVAPSIPATPLVRPSAADVFAAPLVSRPTPPPTLDPEIEALLSDLSAPSDEPAGPSSPDEMVERLDDLARDLSDRSFVGRRTPRPA
jgi:hypothetical protein